jgi:hypothetical protein
MRRMAPLVLGSGTDYSAEQMRPFVATLRETGFLGEVAIVVYHDQCVALRDLVKKFSLSLIPISRTPNWLPRSIGRRIQSRNRMRYVHHWLAMALPSLCRQKSALGLFSQAFHHFYHISSGRYFLYFRYLNRRREKFSYVLLSDVRDVIFQSDPFRYAACPGIFCFLGSNGAFRG